MGLYVVCCQMRAPRRGFACVSGCLTFEQGIRPIEVWRTVMMSSKSLHRRTWLFLNRSCHMIGKILFDEIVQVCKCLFGKVPRSHRHTIKSKLHDGLFSLRISKDFLNSFSHAAWAPLIRLSMSFSADIFDICTPPRHGNYSTFCRTSQFIFSRQDVHEFRSQGAIVIGILEICDSDLCCQCPEP